MIDRALFLNMTASKDVMRAMERVTNNLGNANTPGFKADHYQPGVYHAVPPDLSVNEDGVNIRQGSSSVSFNQGPIENTGRSLDVALVGRGFIAVQNQQGEEAYTRAGNLQITEDGLLTTNKGDLVLGEAGLITLPQSARVNIDRQGIVYAQMLGDNEVQTAEISRIKLVDPDYSTLRKKEDGLFYLPDGEIAQPSRNVELAAEALEGSNVEPVKTLVELIDMSRHFEFQTKMMKSLEDNASASNRLLDVIS